MVSFQDNFLHCYSNSTCTSCDNIADISERPGTTVNKMQLMEGYVIAALHCICTFPYRCSNIQIQQS